MICSSVRLVSKKRVEPAQHAWICVASALHHIQWVAKQALHRRLQEPHTKWEILHEINECHRKPCTPQRSSGGDKGTVEREHSKEPHDRFGQNDESHGVLQGAAPRGRQFTSVSQCLWPILQAAKVAFFFWRTNCELVRATVWSTAWEKLQPLLLVSHSSKCGMVSKSLLKRHKCDRMTEYGPSDCSFLGSLQLNLQLQFPCMLWWSSCDPKHG